MRIDGAALVATLISAFPAFRGEKVFIITSRSCFGSAALIPAFSRGEKEWSAFGEVSTSPNGSRE